MTRRTALVIGATGVTGSSAAAAFAAGWEVHGVSRRLPVQPLPSVRYHSVDLTNRDAAAALRREIGPVQEIAYCAVNEVPGSLVEKWTDPGQVERNAKMLSNLLDAFGGPDSGLKHISVIHGSKAYGVHLPGIALQLPLEERFARVPHPNFYFEHEDELARRCEDAAWGWSIFRAPLILGGGIGSGLSSFLAIGVVAAIAREAGGKLDFPGAGNAMFEVVDADLLAEALLWAADSTAAHNQVFNITNGDVTRWTSLWSAIAAANGVEVGEQRADLFFHQAMAAYQPAWEKIVRKYGLAAPCDLDEFLGASFEVVDFGLRAEVSNLLSTIKLRQAGFYPCARTADRVRGWYDRWRQQKLLPPL